MCQTPWKAHPVALRWLEALEISSKLSIPLRTTTLHFLQARIKCIKIFAQLLFQAFHSLDFFCVSGDNFIHQHPPHDTRFSHIHINAFFVGGGFHIAILPYLGTNCTFTFTFFEVVPPHLFRCVSCAVCRGCQSFRRFHTRRHRACMRSSSGAARSSSPRPPKHENCSLRCALAVDTRVHSASSRLLPPKRHHARLQIDGLSMGSYT